MKKYIIISLCLMITIIGLNKKLQSSNIEIPSSAIRFRIIANSDSDADQTLKYKVKENLSEEVMSLVNDKNNINEVRETIIQNKSSLENNVATTLQNNNSNQTFKLNYGMNYFPQKEFKGITYRAGEYESLVVTLGEGNGQNWWCVLFPPLCLLEAEESNSSDTEYQFFVKELIDKFMSNN